MISNGNDSEEAFWATLIRASHLDLLNGPIWQRDILQKFTLCGTLKDIQIITL